MNTQTNKLAFKTPVLQTENNKNFCNPNSLPLYKIYETLAEPEVERTHDYADSHEKDFINNLGALLPRSTQTYVDARSGGRVTHILEK